MKQVLVPSRLCRNSVEQCGSCLLSSLPFGLWWLQRLLGFLMLQRERCHVRPGRHRSRCARGPLAILRAGFLAGSLVRIAASACESGCLFGLSSTSSCPPSSGSVQCQSSSSRSSWSGSIGGSRFVRLLLQPVAAATAAEWCCPCASASLVSRRFAWLCLLLHGPVSSSFLRGLRQLGHRRSRSVRAGAVRLCSVVCVLWWVWLLHWWLVVVLPSGCGLGVGCGLVLAAALGNGSRWRIVALWRAVPVLLCGEVVVARVSECSVACVLLLLSGRVARLTGAWSFVPM